jgi:hypothetical protein
VQHQLNQQCSATAKSTGKQCERRVVGAPVCWVHGLNAPQVRAKQQQRIALAEAQAAVPATVVVQREPEEILLTPCVMWMRCCSKSKLSFTAGS